MTLAAGTKLAHYTIVSKVGAGGMGEVYLAQDTKLDRKVALKILPADLAANRDRMARFIREAKSTAALNHPNIATIYEIGETDGVNFIAMEFIDGSTLREKIHQEQVELKKLLRYLQYVAEGLAKAHAAGIVHRDLKPDNIMITRDGHAKTLDFGLAKLIEQKPMRGNDSSEVATVMMQQHSTPGAIMGTVGYMSPEQAQGKTNEIDQRSDIFSFGCILFEAATGKKPFEGDSTIKSLHMVIYEPAPNLADVNPLAPPELQRIVRRCLAKDPDERYQSIREVAIELKGLRRELAGPGIATTAPPPSKTTNSGAADPASAGSQSFDPTVGPPASSLPTRASSAEYVITGIKQHKLLAAISLIVLVVAGIVAFTIYRRGRRANLEITSVAVMPFVNESGNQDVEYLSDGMTETLISSLSQLTNLSVKARSSVFRYKGKSSDPKKIGIELNVQAVLNGRVSQRGDQLVLSLELVDTQTENVIWSEQYTRKQADLISLQTEIARDVSNKLRNKLSGVDQAKLAKTYTANPEAYQLYLKGRFYWNKRTARDLQKAVDYFQQAIVADSKFALAFAGLANGYSLVSAFGGAPSRDVMPKAKDAALTAISLDGSLADPYLALGHTAEYYDYDLVAAERYFKQAIELEPNNATAHEFYGTLLSNLGRNEPAEREFQTALQLEPLSLGTNRMYGESLFFARKYDASVTQLKKTIELDESFPSAHRSLSRVYLKTKNYSGHVEEFARFFEGNGEPQYAALIRESFVKGGWHAYLKMMTGAGRPTKHYFPFYAAVYFAELGEKDKAFAELNRTYEERLYYPAWMKADPSVDSLRDDPRFQELLKEVRFPQ